MRVKSTLALALAAGLGLLSAPAAPRAEPHHFGRVYHGRDVHRFERHDLETWRHGRWFHEVHDGRIGWWWFVEGVWYYYPEPIYPYPTYVPETVYVAPAPPSPPPTAPPPPPPPAASAAPPTQYWYYCDDPKGYYPYVPACNAGWRPVPVR